MTEPLIDDSNRHVERKYGAPAARLHNELVSALRRCTNEFSRDAIRRVIQDLNCGRFHDTRSKPRERRHLMTEAIHALPHDHEIKAWRKDLLRRLREGAYTEQA
jgi:hypothetical protein